MATTIQAHLIPTNGETFDDALARLLATQHERAVFKPKHRTWKHYLYLTLTVPDTVGYGELRDMVHRLESAGASVTIR